MTTQNLFEILLEDVVFLIKGNISYKDDIITWEYSNKSKNVSLLKTVKKEDLSIIADAVNLDNFKISNDKVFGDKILFTIRK